MNAAFLLVTSAWLAGGDAPAAAPPAPPAAVTTAPVVSSAPVAGCGSGGCSGCSSCDSGCGCEEREGLFAKLKAKFARGGDCGCGCNAAPSCGCNAAPSCGCEERESFLSRLKGKFKKGCGSSSCGCEAPVEHSCGCNAAPSCGCESGPSFWERMKSKFRHSSDCGCESGCNSCGGCSSCGGSTYSGSSYGAPVGAPVTSPSMPPAGEPVKPPKDLDPGKKLPEGGKETEAKVPAVFEVAPASVQTTEKESHNPFELDRRYQARVDRAADYGWLTGQLFFVHADGGLWVLRYASLSTDDTNGGGVVLARDLPMDSYREGDLVKVHGEVLNQKGSAYLGAPLYRATSIELVERAQP